MPTQAQYYNGLRRHIGAQKIMHDAMTSITSIKCMAKHKETHIEHNGIIGFFAKPEHTWPILTLANMTAKLSYENWVPNMRNVLTVDQV